MTCTRCHGPMFVDAFIDMDDDNGQLWMGAARCLNCGDVSDLAMARNPAAHRTRESACWSRTKVRRPRARRLYPVRMTA